MAAKKRITSLLGDCLADPMPNSPPLAAEVEEGNREYKFKLTNITEETLQHRITQLNWRLNEGNDEAIYQIGVEDDGNPRGIPKEELEESLQNLSLMADAVGCSMTVSQIYSGLLGFTAQVILRRFEKKVMTATQLQVALLGDIDAGKSSLVGVLCTGILDNGRGLARMQVFQHDHEFSSGQTSSVSEHNLYFDAYGKIISATSNDSGAKAPNRTDDKSTRSSILPSLAPASHASDQSLSECVKVELATSDYTDENRPQGSRGRSESELLNEASRVVSIIDLAGHPKYLKTTLHGILGRAPDYAMLCISAKSGLSAMTVEHLGIALAMKIPFVVVLTKIDMVNDEIRTSVINRISYLVSSSTRKARVVHSLGEIDETVTPSLFVNETSAETGAQTIIPLFMVSNVSGIGLDLIRAALMRLPVRSCEKPRTKSAFVRVIDSYHRKCIPFLPEASQLHDLGENSLSGSLSTGSTILDTIFLCQVQCGTLTINDILLFGPISLAGRYCSVVVKSIRVLDVAVLSAVAGQFATVTITHARSCRGNDCSTESISICRGIGTNASQALTDIEPGEMQTSEPLRTCCRAVGLDCCVHLRRPIPGMVLMACDSADTLPTIRVPGRLTFTRVAVWEFSAEILVLNHPAKIRVNYEPVVHVECIQQSARIIRMTSIPSDVDDSLSVNSVVEGKTGQVLDGIGTGERALCRFRFLHYSEVLVVGSTILMREGRIRGVGIIVAL